MCFTESPERMYITQFKMCLCSLFASLWQLSSSTDNMKAFCAQYIYIHISHVRYYSCFVPIRKFDYITEFFVIYIHCGDYNLLVQRYLTRLATVCDLYGRRKNLYNHLGRFNSLALMTKFTNQNSLADQENSLFINIFHVEQSIFALTNIYENQKKKKKKLKNNYTPHSRNYGDTFQYNNQKHLNKSLQMKPTKTSCS